MKPVIALVTGGFSKEDVIAYKSANVAHKHIDASKYQVIKVVITTQNWFAEFNNETFEINKNDFSFDGPQGKVTFDAAFIMIHGTPGEDGRLQGYFDMIGLPYNTCNAATSALTFNKSFCNHLLSSYGIKTAKSTVIHKGEQFTADSILEHVSLPVFVKPNEGGSSINTSKVKVKEDLEKAVYWALEADDQVMIEEFIQGTEITCGVHTFKGKVEAIAVTEIVSKNEFFDYEAKYNDAATEEITPARIPQHYYDECMRTSEFIYKTLSCKGTCRIDYFLTENGLVELEVNTVPGMSEASILPKQAAYRSISLQDLFTNAIDEIFA